MLGGVCMGRDFGDGIGDGLWGGVVEEGAGLAFDDRVERPASSTGNHRATRALGFDRGDSKVFHLREEECTGDLILG